MNDHPFVKGTTDDMGRIMELYKEKQWRQIFNEVQVLLPLKSERAIELLQTIDSDDPMANIARAYMMVRGAALYNIFRIEVNRVLEENKIEMKGKVDITDETVLGLVPLIRLHADICDSVYSHVPFVVLQAAKASSLVGDSDVALGLAKKAHDLDPDNQEINDLIDRGGKAG